MVDIKQKLTNVFSDMKKNIDGLVDEVIKVAKALPDFPEQFKKDVEEGIWGVLDWGASIPKNWYETIKERVSEYKEKGEVPSLLDAAKISLEATEASLLWKQDTKLWEISDYISQHNSDLNWWDKISGYLSDVVWLRDWWMEEQKEKQKQQEEVKEWADELFKDLSTKLKDVNLDNKTLSYLARSYYNDIWKPTKQLVSVVKNEKTKKLEELAEQLKDLFVQKLKEYKWDLEKVRNDKELKELERQWQRYKAMISMESATKSLWNLEKDFKEWLLGPIKWIWHWLESASAWLTAGISALKHWILSDSDYWLSFIKDIRKPSDSVATELLHVVKKTFDNLPELWGMITQVITAHKLPMWWFTKFLTENAIVDWVLNQYLDPTLKQKTIEADMLFDSIATTLFEWISKLWTKALDWKRLKNFEVELPNWEKVKLYKLLWDPKTAEEASQKIKELVDNKWKLDLNLLKTFVEDVVKKLDDTTKTSYKKAFIEALWKTYKQAGEEDLAKFFEMVSKSWSKAAIDKVFADVQSVFRQYLQDIEEWWKRIQWGKNVEEILKWMQLKDRFLKKLELSLKPEVWKVKQIDDIKNIKPQETINVFDIQKITATPKILTDKDVIQNLDNAIAYALKWVKWKWIKLQTFANRLKTYFETIKWWKLTPQENQFIKNISNQLSRIIRSKDFKNIKIKPLSKLWKQIEEWAKWASEKWIIYLNTLKELYKNPEEFFIVLFHELTHQAGIQKLVEQALWIKNVDKVYNEIVNGFKQIYDKVDEPTRQYIDKLFNTILKDKEEFLAYLAGEILTFGGTKKLEQFVEVLKKSGIDIDEKAINEFYQGLQTYLKTRFGLENIADVSRFIRFAKNINNAIREWLDIMKKIVADLWKTRSIWALEKYIMTEHPEKLINLAKQIWKWYSNLNFEDEFVRKVLLNQIVLNAAWENGFKSAIVFTYWQELLRLFEKLENGDLWAVEKILWLNKKIEEILIRTWLKNTEFWEKLMTKLDEIYNNITKKYLAFKLFMDFKLDEEQIRKILRDESLNVERYTKINFLQDIKNFVKTKTDIHWINSILPFFMRYMTKWHIDQVWLSLLFDVWYRTLKELWINLKKSSEDLLSKVVKKLVEDRNLISKDRSIANLFRELWFDVNDVRLAEKWLKRILKWEDAKKILTELEQQGVLQKNKTLQKFIDSEDFIRLNYFRFDPELAYQINRYYIDKNPKLYKLNKQLYNLIKWMLDEANKAWIDVARREIMWLDPKLWAPILETDGKNIIIMANDWRKYVYNQAEKTLEEAIARQNLWDIFETDVLVRQDNAVFETNIELLKRKNNFIKSFKRFLWECLNAI